MSLIDQFPLGFVAMIVCSALAVALQVLAVYRRHDRVALNCARFGTAAVLQSGALLLTAVAAERTEWTAMLIFLVGLQGVSALWSIAVTIIKAVGPTPTNAIAQ